MRKHVFMLALALLMFLLHACADTNYINKGDSAVLTAGHLEIPNTDIAAQEAASPDEQSLYYGYSVSSANPHISEIDDSQNVSPQISPEESNIKAQEGIVTDAKDDETSSSPEDNTTPDINPKLEPVTEMPQNSNGEQPPLMTQAVQEAGLSFDDLAFSQFVLVAGDGAGAMIYCYDKADNGQWTLNMDVGYINGYVGRNGIRGAKREGDDYTPAGLFNLGYAFGNNQKPLTGMVYKTITEESYWVDDPNSKYYNQWVEGSDDADWSSAEHLSDSMRSYAYAVVVEYNMAPNTIAGAGSAIFIHCGNKPTSGCIAVPQETILKILKWLSPDKNPSILIVAQ